ncbi:rhodanese-related sulfurtransferase [Paenibacillus phyllosphaerae]|uniref:Rhodanese-related sulfurtransferase n=1 Tax=Paenibacillus phyllosphaerae TaxID=274593 RepID=A0A7W5FNE2_9BACL|nr:rhodanese-like domain-containing protein [Paenibacillus phyllosphaerae]MBB3111088.1 rhodanese-related sulfurtransferase [Paenibacillus phyllosphaerae]
MMNLIVGLLALWLVVWAYRRFVPVRGLRQIGYEELNSMASPSAGDVQLLDVRDYLEFEQGHHHAAVNLSLGRLSTFWKRHLVSSRPLVVIGANRTEVYAASRFLRKKGFRSISFAYYGREARNHEVCPSCCVC